MSLISSLSKKRLSISHEKNSLLCAGLDPALFQMWRWEKGLPSFIQSDEQLFDRSKNYIDAVAPYVSGLKYNIKYREWVWQSKILHDLVQYAKSLWLFLIEDGKIADIWSTNDSSLYYSEQRAPDTVTIAPYAWNMKWTIQDASKRNLWVFTMCLMSSTEYNQEKHLLVPLNKNHVSEYASKHILKLDWSLYMLRYHFLAYEAKKHEALWVVIGAPSEHNHIWDKEILSLSEILDDEQLVLCPWTWSQWGDPTVLLHHFWSRVVVCMSRWLMFPVWSTSTPVNQRDAAKSWRDKVNVSLVWQTD